MEFHYLVIYSYSLPLSKTAGVPKKISGCFVNYRRKAEVKKN